MTGLITSGHIANAAWFALCWLFFIAVVGSILLARWRERERQDAEETERVMKSLLTDTTHVHEMDGWS